MSIIRVFPRVTSHTPFDFWAFPRKKGESGDPPLPQFRPEREYVTAVHVSCAFTWDMAEAERLADAWRRYYRVVKVGGPAYASPVNGFEPGLYLRHGHTFTSRGCDGDCPWCFVPGREGRLSLTEDFPAGFEINDNNLLQAPAAHRRRVFAMLRAQRKAAIFSGGLSASLITSEIADELRSLRIDQLFLAADTEGALKPLERALRLLKPLGRERLPCYALLAYGGETIQKAEERLWQIWDMGAMPFAILYQGEEWIHYSREWKAVQKTFSRPAATKAEAKRAHRGAK